MKLLSIIMALCLPLCIAARPSRAAYDVVPLPKSIQPAGGGDFTLSSGSSIYVAADSLESNARLLAGYIQQLCGFLPDIKHGGNPAGGSILLRADLRSGSPEAYTLDVSSDGIVINGAGCAGNFYGIQTLRKAIPAPAGGPVLFPPVHIADAPRFAYRGSHFDTARHFMPVDSLERFIDMLALHNINRFHWHITDDQGWRLEIKRRPLLVEKGSWRKMSPWRNYMSRFDSIPHGGHYTQEQARHIVKYAADRHITVIPEIDMPGHMQAALAAYPQLGCTGGPYDVWTRWGVSEDVLCAGNDSVLRFIDDVLTEVMDIFPSEVIHIGGDECPKVRWEQCPKCQARADRLFLTDDSLGSREHKLQSYIISHAADFLHSHGRKAIGWNEILEGGLAPEAMVMSWQGESGGIEAARQGHDVVMSPDSHMYFNYYQSDDTGHEPLAICCYIPLDLVYSYEPAKGKLTPLQQRHIIGVQANLWTEYIYALWQAQYMALPRMAALAEVQWCDPSQRSYDEFLLRLTALTAHYRLNDFKYRALDR